MKDEGNMIFPHAPSLERVRDEEADILVSHLTKDYGRGRGVFDVSFKVPKGKTFGYCGTNGAGKTTTLRHIMGFLKPDEGEVSVRGLDAWKQAQEIKKYIGYLPGEIAFPPLESGTDFLNAQAEMLGLSDMSKANELTNALQLDPTANLKRMSKGMKQKTALVATFMHSPDIILLDEPTTGLDPLMRDSFISVIKKEQARGATIIMSNHMFDELEATCDYVGFIKDGHLLDVVDMDLIRDRPEREFFLVFASPNDYLSFKKESTLAVLQDIPTASSLLVKVKNEETNRLFALLHKHKVKLIKESQFTLEKYFLEHVIGGSIDGSNA